MKNGLTIRQVIVEHFQRYTLAYFIGACFFIISFLTSFSKLFGELTRGDWTFLGWWQICAKLSECVLQGFIAVLAFLNSTKAKIDLKKAEDEAKNDATPPKPLPPSATL